MEGKRRTLLFNIRMKLVQLLCHHCGVKEAGIHGSDDDRTLITKKPITGEDLRELVELVVCKHDCRFTFTRTFKEPHCGGDFQLHESNKEDGYISVKNHSDPPNRKLCVEVDLYP